MDLGFHSVISRALMLHVTADQGRCRQVLNNAELMSHVIHSMDSRADKQKFLEQYHTAFMIPKRLEFQGHQTEDLMLQSQKELPQPSLTAVVECELQKTLSNEMDSRLAQLVSRTNVLRMESDEIWKTVETAEINLLEILNQKVRKKISLGDTNYITIHTMYEKFKNNG
jgi:SLIT-ROBO Rho GTPase activating protein